MFEYITVVLQVILAVAVVACVSRALFSMGLKVYRDRLWIRLAELECLVLEKKSDGSMAMEFANNLLENTKKFRTDFYAPDPNDHMSEFFEILENSEIVPDDRAIIGRILQIYLLFLATKSIVALVAVIVLHNIAKNRRNTTKNVFRHNRASPTSDVARFVQALFTILPIKSA